MSSYQHLEEKDYIEVIPFHGKHNDASSCHSGKSRSNKDNTPITNTQSGSDTEREPSNMSSRTSRHSSGSISRKEKIAASKTKKTDDWTEVTEPDERRRIQNRIAQRKFSTSTTSITVIHHHRLYHSTCFPSLPTEPPLT